MYFFTKSTYNEYIGPYFLLHVVLRFSPNDLHEMWSFGGQGPLTLIKGYVYSCGESMRHRWPRMIPNIFLKHVNFNSGNTSPLTTRLAINSTMYRGDS
jgi:hypothetical protein